MGRKKKDDTPKDDPAMASVRVLFKESGLSLVDLGKKMGYADDVARQATWQFMKSRDPRMSMLRRFAEAMGVMVDQLGVKGKRMARKLDDELQTCGCELAPSDFRELLEEQKAVTSPTWTIDELVCHPDEAKAFCNHIRGMTQCAKLPDSVILRTLMNVRRSH